MRRVWRSACLAITFVLALTAASPAAAWGVIGHRTIALVARSYLTPAVRARVDGILAADEGAIPATDMASASTWADAWRAAGHRETSAWHYVDIELDHPDLAGACHGFPKFAGPASAGPADDCVVDKIEQFKAELASPSTLPGERLLALKYLIHFVGDVHQPLHAADNHDRGGNCVRVALGESRTVNLHAYWDTVAVEALGSDPTELAGRLVRRITPAERRDWSKDGPAEWAHQSNALARKYVYTLRSLPGCSSDSAPIALPAGYDAQAKTIAALQLERAGARLTALLNAALGAAGHGE